MKLLLIGNYGVGNLGDELLREYFLGLRFEPFDIAQGDMEWIIVSAHPRGASEVPRLPIGVRSFFGPWWRTLREYWRCDGMVLGGGTLFTDVESPKACLLWGMHVLMARIFRKPVFLAFQGIGPFRTRRAQWWARFAVRHAAFVSVRDAASAQRARTLGAQDVVLSFDPVILMFDFAEASDQVRNALIIIPRKNSAPSFATRAASITSAAWYSTVRILSFQPDNPFETKACRAMTDALPGASVVPLTTLEELRAALKGAAFVFTERYHGAVAAYAAGIPFEVVSQGEEDKFAAFPTSVPLQELRGRVQAGEAALRKAMGLIIRQKKRELR